MKKGDLAFRPSYWGISLCLLAEDAVSEYVHVYTVKWGVKDIEPYYSIANRDELTVVECKWLKIKYRKLIQSGEI